MRPTPSIEQLRAAGRKRAQQFTPEYQHEMGRRRAQQSSFLAHNQHIAPDGLRAQSAYMRAPCGLRLLRPEHIQFLRPEDLLREHGPNERFLSPREQRLYFGLYVWKAIWQDLAPQPLLPTNEQFLATAAPIRDRLNHGLALEHPLDVVYVAPNDFCDESGIPWASRKQRKLFREALSTGRESAEALVAEHQSQAYARRISRPRKPGQRRPLGAPTPIFQHNLTPPPSITYGRPDLPSYHPYNILPQRPYGIPATNDTHPVYWLASYNEEEDLS